MSYPSALQVKEGIEKILGSYCASSVMDLHITSGSFPTIKAIDVLKAVLNHAIAPSTVALKIWEILQLYFDDVVGLQDNPQSPLLVPHNGNWQTVEAKLVTLSEVDDKELTKKIKAHALEWITRFLLPSMFAFASTCCDG